jgi:transcriptional regulator with XRE-family HTH domain
MYDNDFQLRLAQLRTKKGVSARDMSLSIGQNPGYISNIEGGKALPSMSAFFFICDYLGMTPMEFFETDSENPAKIREITNNLKFLNDEQLNSINVIVKGLLSR